MQRGRRVAISQLLLDLEALPIQPTDKAVVVTPRMGAVNFISPQV
jgi:hypothetical protein